MDNADLVCVVHGRFGILYLETIETVRLASKRTLNQRLAQALSIGLVASFNTLSRKKRKAPLQATA